MNDPFDCDFNTAILDTLGARYSNKEIEMVRESTLDIKRILSISCFSERNDSILMWSHYANKHKGFCACYNLLDILGTHNLFLPVWYRTEKILPLFMGDKLEQNPRIIEIIVQKAPEWSYEREWRLFKYLDIKRLEAGATIKIKPTRIIIGACANEDLKKRLQQIGKDKGIKVTQMTLESGEFKLTEK